jgi:acetyl/propionyl-CoA carboxylase alpha subunit
MLKADESGFSLIPLTQVPAQDIRWCWPERIPRGMVTLIAGYPKSGKSLVACKIAATITNGGNFPHKEGAARRAIWLSGEELQADVAHDGDAITVQFEDGNRHVLSSKWTPGVPVWSGTLDGAAIAVHVRTIPNGFELAGRGIEVKAFVYTEREARYARLMPAKKLSGSEKAVRCPMPGLVVSLAVAEGQRSRPVRPWPSSRR